jgi:hydrogenase maturation protein HypF
MGRLFDVVSSLIGVRHVVSYEAQAAVELETLADEHRGTAREYTFAIAGEDIDATPVLRAVVDDVRNGCEPGAVAAGFHLAVARLVAEVAHGLRDVTGLDQVALSGGVFQNVLLVRLTRAQLAVHEFTVLTHRVVPPNDGGLALGQVAVAGRASLATGEV